MSSPQVIVLTSGQSHAFENGSMTLMSGGHKILMKQEGGGRDGDRSFAELRVTSPTGDSECVRVYQGDITNILGHQVTCTSMGWNASRVELSIG